MSGELPYSLKNALHAIRLTDRACISAHGLAAEPAGIPAITQMLKNRLQPFQNNYFR
jgi:hypothetical protein